MSKHLTLDDQTDSLRGYQQSKAVEAQRTLQELRLYVDTKNDADASKLIDAALLKVHALVGLLLAPRLLVGTPAAAPQLSMLKTEAKS